MTIIWKEDEYIPTRQEEVVNRKMLLEKRMQEAIEHEDYSNCILLRDEINQLNQHL